MAMPERIQRRRTPGWRIPDGAVNVTRPCDWSNPFRVGDYFRLVNEPQFYTGPGTVETRKITTPELAVALFRVYVTDRFEDQIRAELAGRDLCCWCRLDAPCHADILLAIANPKGPL